MSATTGNTYASYGRIFKVEKSGRTGMYWAVGRSRGHRPMFLDKLGPRADKEAMQRALDDWAKRHGCLPASQTAVRNAAAARNSREHRQLYSSLPDAGVRILQETEAQ